MLNILNQLGQDKELKEIFDNNKELNLFYSMSEEIIILTKNGEYMASYWNPDFGRTKRFIMEEIILLNLPDDVAPSF